MATTGPFCSGGMIVLWAPQFTVATSIVLMANGGGGAGGSDASGSGVAGGNPSLFTPSLAAIGGTGPGGNGGNGFAGTVQATGGANGQVGDGGGGGGGGGGFITANMQLGSTGVYASPELTLMP